jgi:hypothetical protein
VLEDRLVIGSLNYFIDQYGIDAAELVEACVRTTSRRRGIGPYLLVGAAAPDTQSGDLVSGCRQESWLQDEAPDTQHALNPAQVDRFRIVRQVEIVLLRPTYDTGSHNNPRPAERLAHRSAPHRWAGNGRATKDCRPSVG